MKIFAIRDERDVRGRDAAHLIYYEKARRFYIELPDDADPWETPLILSTFCRRGEKTVNAYWSRVWVQQRIVPTDRQNLGQILRDNGMNGYDEYQLLTATQGRCAQDSYYITQITEGELPAGFSARMRYKIEDVVPLEGCALLVFFRDGAVKRCPLQNCFTQDRTFAPLLSSQEQFDRVEIQAGGYGVCWGESLEIADEALYRMGDEVPLGQEDFRMFVAQRVVNTAEAAQLLGCSKQNVDDLVRRGKLHPVKESAKSKLFLKSEIIQRSWL